MHTLVFLLWWSCCVNVTIRINDTNYTLQGVANFSGVENITITGKGHSLTQINCNSLNSSGAGIAFDNSSHNYYSQELYDLWLWSYNNEC